MKEWDVNVNREDLTRAVGRMSAGRADWMSGKKGRKP